MKASARNYDDEPELLHVIREIFRNVLNVNEGYTRESFEEVLDDGRANLISFGVPFISNPDLPRRLKEEIPLSEPNKNTFYSTDKKGYTDYSFF